MNPWQAWKAKLEGALFWGVHNCRKNSVTESKILNWLNLYSSNLRFDTTSTDLKLFDLREKPQEGK